MRCLNESYGRLIDLLKIRMKVKSLSMSRVGVHLNNLESTERVRTSKGGFKLTLTVGYCTV